MSFLTKIFCRNNEEVKPKIVVTEVIEGTWYYHLSYDNKTTRSLCGERVMQTNFSLDSWGHVGHLHERYCEKCKKIYDGVKL